MDRESPVIYAFHSRKAAMIAYAAVVVVSAGAAYWSAQISAASSRAALETVAVASAQQSRESAVAGCERTKADRLDAITGWQRASRSWAAVRDDPNASPRLQQNAAGTVAVYTLVIDGYRQRIVNCQEAFPPINVRAVRGFIRENAK